MSEIVLGLASSHSPLLTIEPTLWVQRAQDDMRREKTYLTDGRVLPYAQVAAEMGDVHASQATPETFARQAAEAQTMLDHLAQEILKARPDALVIVGDDQEELFDKSHMPALAIYSGQEIVMLPRGQIAKDLPEWRKRSTEGYAMDAAHRYPAAQQLAVHMIERLIAKGVDVSVASKVEDPTKAGFGHAFGFILRRLCGDRKIPIVPIMLNTYYPPNVPTPARCYDIGMLIAASIEAAPQPQRIAIVASGGMTHFMNDEAFDRRVLKALIEHDRDTLRTLPVHALRSGTSEILNWVMVAGAMQKLDVSYSDYIPVRRTPAGTGIGLGFVSWTPRPPLSTHN
jgi:aromatic ring-opening dioxygenase catalytic subunit (LigB family)